jgi:hypothetical protein
MNAIAIASSALTRPPAPAAAPSTITTLRPRASDALLLTVCPGFSMGEPRTIIGPTAQTVVTVDGGDIRVRLALEMPGLGRDMRDFHLTPARFWTQTQHYVDSLRGFDVTLSAAPAAQHVETTVSMRVEGRRRTVLRGAFAYADRRPSTAWPHWDEIDPGVLARIRRAAPAPDASADRAAFRDAQGAADLCALLGAARFPEGAARALRRIAAEASAAWGYETALVYAFGAEDDKASKGDALGAGVWTASDGAAGWFGPRHATRRGGRWLGRGRSACLAAGPSTEVALDALRRVGASPDGGWRLAGDARSGGGVALSVTAPAGAPFDGDRAEFAASALCWLRGPGAGR